MRKVGRIALPVETHKAVEPVRQAVNELADHPLLDGVLVEGVKLPDDQVVRVRHGLGRRWRGYLVLSLAFATEPSTAGWIQVAPGGDRARELWLKAKGWSQTAEVNLWVA